MTVLLVILLVIAVAQLIIGVTILLHALQVLGKIDDRPWPVVTALKVRQRARKAKDDGELSSIIGL